MRPLACFFALSLSLALTSEAPAQALVRGGMRGGNTTVVRIGNPLAGNAFVGNSLLASPLLGLGGVGCQPAVQTNAAFLGQSFAAAPCANAAFGVNSVGVNPFALGGATVVVNRNIGNRFATPFVPGFGVGAAVVGQRVGVRAVRAARAGLYGKARLGALRAPVRR